MNLIVPDHSEVQFEEKEWPRHSIVNAAPKVRYLKRVGVAFHVHFEFEEKAQPPISKQMDICCFFLILISDCLRRNWSG